MDEGTIKKKNKQFKCTICDKTLTTKYGLISHTLSHTGEKPWVCEHCSQSFRDQSSLIDHRKTHAPGFEGFKCEFCGKSFNYKKRMNEHIRLVHLKISTPSMERKKQKRKEKQEFLGLQQQKEKKESTTGVVCQECGKWFKKSAKLKIHIHTVHMDKGAANPMDFAISLPGSEFKCKNCDALFKNKKGVISHIRIVHFDLMMEIRDKDIESVFNEKATEAEVKIAEELTRSTVVEQNTSIVNLLSENQTCKLCDKTFKPSYLKEHIIVQHGMKNNFQAEPLPSSISILQTKVQSQLIKEYRGEEVVLALDFVRDMDEEELQHILDQAEALGLRKAMEGIGLTCGRKVAEDSVKEEEDELGDFVKEENVTRVKQEVDYGELEEGELKMTMEESYEGRDDDIGDFYDEELECESIFDDPGKCNPEENESRDDKMTVTDGEVEKESETKKNPEICTSVDEADILFGNGVDELDRAGISAKSSKLKEEDKCEKELPGLKSEEEFNNESQEKVKPSERVRKRTQPRENATPICPTCGKSFQKMSKLKRHMITHMGVQTPKHLIDKVHDDLFRCSICSKEFKASNAAYEHIRLYHMNLYEKADPSKKYTPRRLKLPANLLPKVSKSQAHLCQTCGQNFSGRTMLERHIKTIHEGIKEFTCDYCRKELTSSYGLKAHIETIHLGIRQKCPHCESDFSTQKALKHHIETTHLKNVCHTCNQCGKSFPTEGRLENHKYEHETGHAPHFPNGNGKFRCDECGKEYASLPGLRVHIDVVHKGLKNHTCQICGQSFGRRSCLAAHKQTHHGLGPNPGKRKKSKMMEEEKVDVDDPPIVHETLSSINM